MASRVQKIMFWDTLKNAKSVILHFFPVAEIGRNINLLYFSYLQEIYSQFVEWEKNVLSPYSPQWSVHFSVSLLLITRKHPVYCKCKSSRGQGPVVFMLTSCFWEMSFCTPLGALLEPPPIDIIIFSPQNHWWWYLYLVFPSYCSLLEVNFLTAIIKMLIFVEKCIVKYLQQLHPPKNLSEKVFTRK